MGRPKEFKHSYWTPELDESDRKCAEASRQKHTEEGRKELQLLRAKHRKARRLAKKNWWHELMSSMTDTKELARLTKNSTTHQLGLLKKPGGGICDEEEVAEILLDEHAPGSYEAPAKREKPRTKLHDVEIRRLRFMTVDLLKEALGSFGKKKKRGARWPDGHYAPKPPAQHPLEDVKDHKGLHIDEICADYLAK